VSRVVYVAIGTVTPGNTATITLAASNTSIVANGFATTTITATLLDINARPVAVGTPVKFETTMGSFSNGSKTFTAYTTTTSGTVSATLIAGTTAGTAEVSVSSGSVTQYVNIQFTGAGVPGEVASITLTAVPTSIPADGESSSTITATLKDVEGDAVAIGTRVTFRTTLGYFRIGGQSITLTTNDTTGTVIASLIAGFTTGIATVTCEAGGVTQVITVAFTAAGVPPNVASIALSVNPASKKIPADGSTSMTITATIKTGEGNAAPIGTPVSFTTTLGTFSNGQQQIDEVTSDTTGIVTVSLISSTTPGTAEVVCSSLGVTQRESVFFTGPGAPGETAVITLTANPTSIKGDGASSSTITATLKDANLDPVFIGTAVTFTTNLGFFENGLQVITGTTASETGVVSITLFSEDITPATDPEIATITCESNGVFRVVTVQFTVP
jgi:hypothetical protein